LRRIKTMALHLLMMALYLMSSGWVAMITRQALKVCAR